jgi:cyclopropane fatty-acyl-phospholipid synthase-like methyltransferase
MTIMRPFYEMLYRQSRATWDGGPREPLVRLIESGEIEPGRAIDLGCGTGSNAVFLAQNGFDVTGVDYARAAIEKGRERAEAAGVDVAFVVDDLTNLSRVQGPYDLLVDIGTLDDLTPRDRERYVANVLPLTVPGSQFLLYTFEWPFRWWERVMFRLAFFAAMAMEPGDVERLFGGHFEIERIGGAVDLSRWPPGEASYLMSRKGP